MNLEDFLSPDLLENSQKIITVSVQVTQEAILKEKILFIDKKFLELTFPLVPFREESPKDATYLLGDCNDIMNDLDSLTLQINQVYGS